MGLARPRALAVLACLSVLLVMAAAGGEALAAKAPTAKSSLKSLLRQTNALPAGAAPAAKRAALKRRARTALRSARRRPCASVRALNQFRGILGKLRVKTNTRKRRRAARRLSALGPASLTSSRLLLANRRTRRCGGGVKLRQRGNNPTVRVMTSNANAAPRSRGAARGPVRAARGGRAVVDAARGAELRRSRHAGDSGHPRGEQRPGRARRRADPGEDERRRQGEDDRGRRVPGAARPGRPGHRASPTSSPVPSPTRRSR